MLHEPGFPPFRHNQWTVEGEIERFDAFGRGAFRAVDARRVVATLVVLCDRTARARSLHVNGTTPSCPQAEPRSTRQVLPLTCGFASSPWHGCGMTVVVETITIDCDEPTVVAAFWRALLGFRTVPHPTSSVRIAPPDGSFPHFLFTPAGRTKDRKNPSHFDLRPDDQAATVERALSLGARRVDIGQTGEESWMVLADPEGNEFCVLQSTADLARWHAQQDA